MSEPTAKRALQVVRKKLLFRSDRQINEMLELAADDKAEAYRIGAEETQHELILRIEALIAGGANK